MRDLHILLILVSNPKGVKFNLECFDLIKDPLGVSNPKGVKFNLGE